MTNKNPVSNIEINRKSRNLDTKTNFLITGYGRSGTKYLSKMLNKSKKWTVLHEPRKSFDEIDKGNKQTNIVQNVFDSNKNYGEVNSYLRFHYQKLDIGKMGIIIRNPLDIYLSVCNRKNEMQHTTYLNDIVNAYENFITSYGSKIFFLKFEEIIGNPVKISELCAYLEISDLTKSDFVIDKINQNKVVKYEKLDDLPKGSVSEIAKLIKIKKWYDEVQSYY